MNVIDIAAKRTEVRMEPGDYSQDGLIYCGHCHTPKQCRISVDGNPRVFGCQCACKERQYQAELKARRDEEMRLRIEELRVNGIADREIREYSFADADDTPEIERAKHYAQDFKDMEENNVGLLFWGGVGSGKTFAAGCIANALISSGIPALVTSIPSILAAPYNERGEIISGMSKYPLLVLDDLGAERGTEFAVETVYNVIDARYKSKRPLIVTTNLCLDDLRHPKDVDYARIYDRVLSMCTPVCFKGPSRRKKDAERKTEILRRLFS